MTSSAPTSRAQQAPLPASSSSTNAPPPTGGATEKSYFETQRAALIGEIAISMEHVLSNINKLNRSLEGVIAVGNEFGSVEALWSQFENVMAKDTSVGEGGPDHATAGGGGGGGGSERGHGRGEGDDDED